MFNRLFNLTCQDAQVRCFRNVARHLTPRGVFVVEAFVPDVAALKRQNVRAIPMRYAWPSELDLMARLAGLTLRERWGGWGRSPFTASSSSHVSVYERAGTPG